MPVYQVAAFEGTLDDAERARLAEEITRIHCEATGAPALFVHVVFQDVEPGRVFSAGRPSRLSLITGTIRGGRTIETRQQMMRNLADAWVTATGGPINDVLVAIEEIDPRMAMELGLIFPNPGEEPVWFEQHKDRLAELGVTSLA